jgi:hypothetical protein
MAANSTGKRNSPKKKAKAPAPSRKKPSLQELAQAEYELFDDYVPGIVSDVPDFRDVGGSSAFTQENVSRSQYEANISNMNQLFLRTEVLAEKVKSIMGTLDMLQGMLSRLQLQQGMKEGKF